MQCLVLVRDDFWMAATRFMGELEVPLVAGRNSAAVDLFPVRHAEKVLAAFGRAFGSLPDAPGNLARDQQLFLEQAVSGLAQDGKVICVRLALFAQMMKDRPWTPPSLRSVGGTLGVGATFLEETFSAAAAPPDHRYHQEAARAVLKALLPSCRHQHQGADEVTTGIAGRFRLCQPPERFRKCDSHPRRRAATDHPHRRTNERRTREDQGWRRNRIGFIVHPASFIRPLLPAHP